MYTWEIKDLFEKRNYELDNYTDFYNIYTKSPQFKIIKYEETINDKAKYYFKTSDNFEGWIWIKNKGSE